MEKEDMIKVMVAGLAVLVIAAPLLIGTMTALTEDGPTYTYTVETEDEYDEETGELLSMTPRRALDMVEYAKSKGADSWELTVYYGSYDYTIYKNGRIIEEVTDSPNWGIYQETLWYIHSDGYGCTYPYSTSVYLYNETMDQSSGLSKLAFTSSRGTTEIKGYNINDEIVYEQTVKLEKLWFINVHGNYIVGPNDNVQFVDIDDIYIFNRAPNLLIHGDRAEYNIDGTVYEGTAEYSYTGSSDTQVKTLDSVDISVRWYSENMQEWVDIEIQYEGMINNIITPAELTYKEPYVKGNMAAMVVIIPAIVLLGIGLYLFKRLSNSE